MVEKKKIAVVTATRAEYGLLKSIILKLNRSDFFSVELVVTGMHLSSEFGLTYKEIEEDQIKIDKKIEILLDSDTSVAMSKVMGLAMISFAEYFESSKPDALMVLGDRYEMLAICSAAMNAQIPIIHLYGGETTEGVVDEAIRHAITKMSYLHFTSTEKYRKRVIQMGEQPDRVFNVGALGVENVLNTELLSYKELENALGISLDRPYAIVTFHPVTLESDTAIIQVKELFLALDKYPEYIYICTKANADSGGRGVNKILEEFSKEKDNVFVYESLGMKRYLSAVKYAKFVIGNSSSGIVEVPSFGIPTINIGDRQKGRIQAESVINCLPNVNNISRSIEVATSSEFANKSQNVKNPYGNGNTSDQIIEIMIDMIVNKEIEIKKKFYDIDFMEN